jgi:hypothetical protein
MACQVCLLCKHRAEVAFLTSIHRSEPSRGGRPNPRSRSNTVRSYTQTVEPIEETAPIEIRPTIKSSRSVQNSAGPSLDRSPVPIMRPSYGRATTYNDSSPSSRDLSPNIRPGVSRIPSDSLMIRTARSNLRNVDEDIFADDPPSYTNGSDRSYDHQSVSPATSHGSDVTSLMGKKSAAPPPPPSRAKKPPPPPIPAKRSSVIYT